MVKRTIFVTVGTTRFDLLTTKISRPEGLQWMQENGYSKLVIQYGKGDPVTVRNDNPIEVETYEFKSSLEQDIPSIGVEG